MSSSATQPPVVVNLGFLLVLAALAGAFALVLFSVLGRVESRAHWGREKGIARGRRLERRAFVIGVIMVAAMAAAGLTIYLNRTAPCTGSACFDPGP